MGVGVVSCPVIPRGKRANLEETRVGEVLFGRQVLFLSEAGRENSVSGSGWEPCVYQ